MVERKYRYVGEPMLTRGDYGVSVEGGHTREDDPDGIYVHDPDFGEFVWCRVEDAERCGMVPAED